MKLAIMTKSTFFVEEDKILASLFDEGLDDLHLFKPGSSPMYSERLLTLLDEEYYKKITVHDHFYLKEEYQLRGIHLDDPQTEIPNGYKGKTGVTCTDLEQLKPLKKRHDYIFLDGVFADSLRQSQSDYTDEALHDASHHGWIDRHVYAMGGVTIERIKQAKDMGFGGVVIGDDLWDKFNIHQGLDYKELISYFEKLKKATD
jgi:thiamine-phosphate pyrophosphorylase